MLQLGVLLLELEPEQPVIKTTIETTRIKILNNRFIATSLGRQALIHLRRGEDRAIASHCRELGSGPSSIREKIWRARGLRCPGHAVARGAHRATPPH